MPAPSLGSVIPRGVTPPTDMEVLSQQLPNEVFDDDTLCRPYLLIPKLPPFPATDWTRMHLRRTSDGDLESSLSYDPLDGVNALWHPRQIDILSLKRLASYKGRVKEVEFEGKTALSKAAIFDWWIPQVEHETNIYEVISRNQDPEQPIAPLFLGHLTEQGRPMGFLMEKIDGRAACLDDLPACEEVLRKLHRMGWIHGDTNRYNFLVDRATGQVKMIDFEHAEPYEEEKARQELEGLRAELTETTGRGTSVTVVDGVEVIAGPLPYYYPPGNGSS